MKYQYDSYKSIFVVNKNLTIEKFLKEVDCEKGSYAEDMFYRVYRAIFAEAKNLEELYSEYYKQEYQSLREFLYKKYCIEFAIIEDILKKKQSNPNFILLDVDDFAYGDYGVFDYAFSEDMGDRVINILSKDDI